MPAQEVIYGESFSITNIELTWQGLEVAGIRGIKYDDDLKRTVFYGTGSIPIGLTRGSYMAKGTIIFRKKAFIVAVLAALGPGFRQVPGTAVVTYGPNGDGLLEVDTIPQFFIGRVSSDNEYSEESPPLDNELDIYIPVPILWNGVPSVIETFTQIAVA